MLSLWQGYQTWTRDILRFEYRVALSLLLIAGLACLAIGFGFTADAKGKWINSAGLLFDVGGVIQLHVSGLFDDIMTRYSDTETYPSGPPSNITRRIIDNPDAPIRMWVRSFLFFDPTTGFRLLLAGFAFQLLGTWA